MGENPDSGFKGMRLYNTLTHAKQDFLPIDAAHVRVYVCGPTVYDDAHIGNARPAIVFDVLYRLLRYLYGDNHVTYVRNITDVDDKINARAGEDYPDLPLNEAIAKVTAETEAQYHADIKALGCLEPDVEPRATEHIAEMVEMVRILIDKNHAYAAEGHVLFDVKGWKNAQGEAEYGKLSRRPLDEMIAGARVEVAPYKRDPMDFVLWKPSSAEEPGWDSPWGRGRPGWHLECSAMSEKHLGKTFDIHGGGIDLVFPHHENEIAQSRCAHGSEVMANYWLHNGFLQVEGEKMAKSAGNFVTIRDLLHTRKFGGLPWPGDAVRLAMLTAHYRQPIDWTENSLETAGANLHTFHRVCVRGLRFAEDERVEQIKEFSEPVPSEGLLDALCDDLNTPKAIFSHLFDVVKQADQKGGVRSKPAETLLNDCLFLGLDPFRFHREELTRFDAQKGEIDSLIDARVAARAEADISKSVGDMEIAKKHWAEADRIRGELDAMGIQLMDAKDPETGELVTTWEVKR